MYRYNVWKRQIFNKEGRRTTIGNLLLGRLYIEDDVLFDKDFIHLLNDSFIRVFTIAYRTEPGWPKRWI